jgi:hypothetical protein
MSILSPFLLSIWLNFNFPAVLLIRTYAFFNRNVYVLMFLVTAMTGVVAYQLYVDTSQMLCELRIPPLRSLPTIYFHSASFRHAALCTRLDNAKNWVAAHLSLQDKGPCLPRSRPHSAHLLGRSPWGKRLRILNHRIPGFFVRISTVVLTRFTQRH